MPKHFIGFRLLTQFVLMVLTGASVMFASSAFAGGGHVLHWSLVCRAEFAPNVTVTITSLSNMESPQIYEITVKGPGVSFEERILPVEGQTLFEQTKDMLSLTDNVVLESGEERSTSIKLFQQSLGRYAGKFYVSRKFVVNADTRFSKTSDLHLGYALEECHF